MHWCAKACTLYGVRIVALTLLTAGVAGAVLASCGTTDEWFYSCPHPDEPLVSDIGPNGAQDPCHRQDAGPAECPAGECMAAPAGWTGPYLTWVGDYGQAPDCPDHGLPAYDGNDDLVAPLECEPCSCGPSTGSCALPSKLTAHDVPCSGVKGPHKDMPFDAPASWSGQCDKTDPVPQGFAYSLTIDPLVVKESCPVLSSTPTRILAPYWRKSVRTCRGQNLPCDVQSALCMAKPPTGPTWRVCIFMDGEHECPGDNVGAWSERLVFYDPVHGIDDQRTCTECSCGAPKGSMCTAQVYSYSDASCSVPVDPGYTISSEGDKCIDIMPTKEALGSKAATPPTYAPGTCDAIPGVAMGAATKINPSTLCCKYFQ